MAEEKRPPAEKPLVVPMSFGEALTMIAKGGKVPSQNKKRRKPVKAITTETVVDTPVAFKEATNYP